MASANNTVGPNVLWNTATGGTILRWTDGNFDSTLAQVNAVTGQSGNVVSSPSFRSLSSPLCNGLALTASPGGVSVALTGQVDILGKAYAAGDASFGPYFTP